MFYAVVFRSNEEIANRDLEIKKALKQFREKLIPLIPKFYKLKTDAFEEEKEWRILAYYLNGLKQECSFFARSNVLVPYREYSLDESKVGPIVEVVIGPKNLTPIAIVEDFLMNSGYNDVNVIKSRASYR